MRLARLAACCLALVPLLLIGCGSNDSADTRADVILTADITAGPADADICSDGDIIIATMAIKSQAKAPGARLSQQQDVRLSEWVVTPIRTDGGTVASPVFRNYYNVTVPAGGTATTQNYRIFPAEYYHLAPLSYLLPENGGIDPETGKDNIRQNLSLSVYGKTIAGDPVVLGPIPITINFTCGS